MGSFATFLAVSILVIVTPGPDTALTIRNTLLGGRRGGIATACGVATGQATWAICTAAGVAAVLSASQPVLTAVRIAGAAYLTFLGLQSITRAVAGHSQLAPAPHGEARGARPAVPYRQGLISNLSNPKMVVFFISLLPQFIGPHASFASLLALGLVFCAMTLGWLSAYAAVVARAGAFLRGGRIGRLLDAATGAVLVGLGLRLLAGDQR